MLSLFCKAQEFVIVNDPDGHVNIRKESSTKSAILWRAYDDELLINYDINNKQKNWLNVAIATDIKDSLGKPILKNHYQQGFIFSNRVIFLNQLSRVKNRKISNNKLIIKNDSIALTLTTRPFKSQRHKVYKDKNGYLNKLDGKFPYGIDGGLPHAEIAAISLTVHDQLVNIPRSFFNDLYEPSLQSWNVYLDHKGKIYIYSLNSDGAGSYSLVFVINRGKLIRRYIDNSEA